MSALSLTPRNVLPAIVRIVAPLRNEDNRARSVEDHLHRRPFTPSRELHRGETCAEIVYDALFSSHGCRLPLALFLLLAHGARKRKTYTKCVSATATATSSQSPTQLHGSLELFFKRDCRVLTTSQLTMCCREKVPTRTRARSLCCENI